MPGLQAFRLSGNGYPPYWHVRRRDRVSVSQAAPASPQASIYPLGSAHYTERMNQFIEHPITKMKKVLTLLRSQKSPIAKTPDNMLQNLLRAQQRHPKSPAVKPGFDYQRRKTQTSRSSTRRHTPKSVDTRNLCKCASCALPLLASNLFQTACLQKKLNQWTSTEVSRHQELECSRPVVEKAAANESRTRFVCKAEPCCTRVERREEKRKDRRDGNPPDRKPSLRTTPDFCPMSSLIAKG